MSTNRCESAARKMVLFLAVLGLGGVLGSDAARAADTIDVVVDAFATGGQLLGISLGSTERAVVKDLLRCTAVEGKALPDCARRAVTSPLLSQVPPDLRPVAQCLISGTAPPTCATRQVLDRLPPEARGVAQCIGRGRDIGTCGKQFATEGALKQAFDVINGLQVDRVASNPMLQADRTVQNIICTIQGVNHEDWVEVVHCGGTEVAKKVVRAILSTLVSPAVVSVLGPAIDGMMQDRVDFVAEIVKAAKARDERKLAELATEAFILTGTPLAGLTAICHLMPDGAVKKLTCGTIGKAVRWTTGAVGDAGEGIVDVAEDVALALGGNQCKAAPLFYRDTIAGCLPWGVSQLSAAFLKPGSELEASYYPDLENQIYAQCRRDVQVWYKRGLFGTTSTTACANTVCDLLRAQFQEQAHVVTQAMLDTASAFGRAALYRAEVFRIGGSGGREIYRCQRWGADSKFVSDCTNTLKREFPYLEGGSGAPRCTILGTPVTSSGPFLNVCQAELDRRVGKRGTAGCTCPEGTYRLDTYGDDGFVCSREVPQMPLPSSIKDRLTGPAGIDETAHAVQQMPGLKDWLTRPSGVTEVAPTPAPAPPRVDDNIDYGGMATPSSPSSGKCVRGMTLTAGGRCACRPGTRWNGRRCVGASTPPVAVPSGGFDTSQSPTRPIPSGGGGFGTSQSPAIPNGRPGNCPHGLYWQNGRCACPPGKAFIRGYCRDVAQKPAACPPGSYGTRPNCKCPPRWQWSGARCIPMQRPIPIPQQAERQCPGGSIGHWPRCYRPQPQTPQAERQCPGGFGHWPRCYRPSLQTPQAVRQCPTGFVGHWPRCHRWRPQPPKCSPGSIGTWPKCGSVVR